MPSRRLCWAAVALLLALLAAPLAPAAAVNAQVSAQEHREPPDRAGGARGYLALGDSYAAGVGASDPAATGYAALVAQALLGRRRAAAVNLAQPGATSADFVGDFVARGRRGAGSSQLAQAVRLLAGGRFDVVTLQIGGNDVLRLLGPGQPCAGAALESAACGAAARAAEAQVATNLVLILDALARAAPPGAQLVVLTYPNPFGGQRDPIDLAIRAVDAGIVGAVTTATKTPSPAAAHRVTLTAVDVYPLFVGRVATLTHITDTPPDVHPTDAGHRVLAQAVLAALRPGERG
jgi:lysophospholipase L1-like esterase